MATPYTYAEITNAMRLDEKGVTEPFTELMLHPERFYTFACGKGETYLFKACKYTLRAVQFFLLHCDINTRDDNGRTILWNVIYHGTMEILEFVLPRMSAEAIATQDRYGDTVLHIAKNNIPHALPLLLNYITEDTQGKKNSRGDLYMDDPRRPRGYGRMAPKTYLMQSSNQYTRTPLQPAFKTVDITQMTGRIDRTPSLVSSTDSNTEETRETISFEKQVARAFYALPQEVRDGERGLGSRDLPADPMVKQGIISILASLGAERCRKKIAEDATKKATDDISSMSLD